jgi:hypothetical protein
MNADVVKYLAVLAVGLFLGLGISALFSGPESTTPEATGKDYSSLRLQRDNESLRRYVEQLENQVAAWEDANSESANQTNDEEAGADEVEPTYTQYAENPAQLGSFVGSLRRQWDTFREQYRESRPSPGDPGYAEFLAGYQQMVSQAAVLGAQVSTMPTYQPSEFAAFHSEFAVSYLGLQPLTKEKIQPVVEDLVLQLNEHNLGRDSFPQERSEMREWIRNRNRFEREATKIVSQSLPTEYQEAYIAAFDDDIFESGISDMMREMRRFIRVR